MRCEACCQENCDIPSCPPCSCQCHWKLEYYSMGIAGPSKSAVFTTRSSIMTMLGVGHNVMTASEISRSLGIGLSSVSSLLRRMVAAGEILRVAGFGPRGGYGYLLRKDGSDT